MRNFDIWDEFLKMNSGLFISAFKKSTIVIRGLFHLMSASQLDELKEIIDRLSVSIG